MNNPILYIVIPCFNEEEVLPETSKKLIIKINELMDSKLISNKSKILFINDGSKDKTWTIIQNLNTQNNIYLGINLSKNYGHQNALLAGLLTSKNYADIVISMDADLQDDISVIDNFIYEYNQGNDIVYGVRNSRKYDTFFKRTSAILFYKLMNLLGAKIVYNHADYRLMSKKAIECLNSFKEVNLFLRGIVPLLGFKSSIVKYERHERFAGSSKYPLRKMIAFALNGITSFSVKPIILISFLGFSIFILSIIALVYSLISKLSGNAVNGWTSLTISIWMIGGIQLLSLGIIGEYIGKIYSESKQRPRFIISDKLLNTH